MGFFGKKKQRQSETATSSTSSNKAADTPSTSAFRPQERREQFLKTLPYGNKSVRFASEVSDDEGGFVTDSELEINRSTRYGSLRVRPSPSMVTSAPASSTLDRTTIGRSQSYDQGRSHSYSERQQYSLPPRAASGSLWASNGVSRPYQNGSTSVDDDYMSDSSTASSFARGARLRSSLPIMKHVTTKPVGLVFLTYQNETKKTVLPNEIKNLDTIKAMFLRCFSQQLTPDMLNSPKRRFYILDRSSNKFFLLIHLQEVRDGTMLKLVDSDALTPSTVRRSHSAHSGLTSDSHYFSEPEFDQASTRVRIGGQRPLARMAITKETNIDDPITGTWNSNPQQPVVSQPVYHKPAFGSCPHSLCHPLMREAHSDWNIYGCGVHAGPQPIDHMTAVSSHMTSSSHALTDAGTTQGNYIPPQVLQSTVHSTKLDPTKYSLGEETDSASISSKDSFTSRNRMAKMESQIANLTAMVQTAFNSRPGSAASDRISELSYQSNRSKDILDYSKLSKMLRSGISGTSSSTPQPGVSVELQQSIKSASERVKDLKAEFKQLRRIHEAQAESIQDTITDALSKIQNVVNGIPGANRSPLRSRRHAVDVSLDAYKTDQCSVLNQISELEACVAELRSDVVSKRCHVNITEVEALALNLSKATRSAADIKAKFPRLVKDLKSVSQNEMDSVLQQQEFISQEPDRIEDALRRCKTVTNVLFTLKRLAAIDSHRTAVVPKLQTFPVEESTKKQLLQQIEMITPDHSERLKSIANAEKSLARRKDILLSKDVLKFEKSLELATKSLKDAEKLPKSENGLEKLAAQVRECKVQSSLGSPRSSHHSSDWVTNSVVVRRARAQPKEASLPFIQNRDSIHWDAESDSDEDRSPKNGEFVDITESPASAFTVVNKDQDIRNSNHINGNHSRYNHSSPERFPDKNSIPNGRVYTSPKPDSSQARRKDLEQQCQKLQELQENHRRCATSPKINSLAGSTIGPQLSSPRQQIRPQLTSPMQQMGPELTSPRQQMQPKITSPRQQMESPQTSPRQHMGSQLISPRQQMGLQTTNRVSTPVIFTGNGSMRNTVNGNGVKPTIAPKPQLRTTAKLSTPPEATHSSEQEYSSSSESDNEYHLIKEPKSTTV